LEVQKDIIAVNLNRGNGILTELSGEGGHMQSGPKNLGRSIVVLVLLVVAPLY